MKPKTKARYEKTLVFIQGLIGAIMLLIIYLIIREL
jgi:hypothetical protein